MLSVTAIIWMFLLTVFPSISVFTQKKRSTPCVKSIAETLTMKILIAHSVLELLRSPKRKMFKPKKSRARCFTEIQRNYQTEILVIFSLV